MRTGLCPPATLRLCSGQGLADPIYCSDDRDETFPSLNSGQACHVGLEKPTYARFQNANYQIATGWITSIVSDRLSIYFNLDRNSSTLKLPPSSDVKEA